MSAHPTAETPTEILDRWRRLGYGMCLTCPNKDNPVLGDSPCRLTVLSRSPSGRDVIIASGVGATPSEAIMSTRDALISVRSASTTQPKEPEDEPD